MSDHSLIFRDAPESADYPAELLEGAVPAELQGCLLRNGPGIQRAGADAFHLLDGYGCVAGLYFDGGTPAFRLRHVATPLFAAERAAGKQLARRPFTNLPTRLSNLFNVKMGNTAGHDVYGWGGKIYASDVPGHFEVDVRTLETLGPAPINAEGGGIRQLSPMPRIDPTAGRLVAYSIVPGVLGPDTITFHEYDPDWKEVHRQTVNLPVKSLQLHDHAFTANHYVVVQFGRLQVGQALLSRTPMADAVHYDEAHPARILIVPRGSSGPVRAIDLGPGQQTFHLFNAFEQDGALVIDAVIYDSQVHFHEFYPPELKHMVTNHRRSGGPFVVRHTHHLQTGVTRSVILDGVKGESPTINPALMGRRHRYGYVASQTATGDEPIDNGYFWFHGVTKVDFEGGQHQSWSAGPRTFCSPPAFVARRGATGEDDGWLLCWLLDATAQRSQVVVIDAKDLAAGPVARLGLKDLLPAVSHTEFVNA